MYKNTTHTVDITAFSSEGSGIAKIDGYTVFVPSAVLGDKAEILVVKENKNYGFGKLLRVLEPSPLRCNAPCPLSQKCGGCDLQSVSYDGQLEFKRKKVEDAIVRIGGFDGFKVKEIVASRPNLHYRNKAIYPVSEENGRIVCGFYAPHSHRVIPTRDCLLADPRTTEIANFITDWATENSIDVFDENTSKGTLRKICIRAGKDESVVVIVCARPIKSSSSLVKELTDRFPFITGIVENYNSSKTNTIYGDKDNLLYGRPYIYDSIGEVKYKIHYRGFYQVNPYTTKLLYDKVKSYCIDAKDKNVFDLYCGSGTIGLYLANDVKKVTGIEIVPESIENARENAELNSILNATFYCGKSEEVMPALLKEGHRPDIVVLDPPRKGCEESLLSAVASVSPEKIIYVSCDCATMARDLRILCENGYTLKEATAFDQFPQTCHVECVALLTLSNYVCRQLDM